MSGTSKVSWDVPDKELLDILKEIVVKNNLHLKRSLSYSSEVGLDNIINRYKYFTDREVEIKKTESEFVVKIPLIKQS